MVLRCHYTKSGLHGDAGYETSFVLLILSPGESGCASSAHAFRFDRVIYKVRALSLLFFNTQRRLVRATPLYFAQRFRHAYALGALVEPQALVQAPGSEHSHPEHLHYATVHRSTEGERTRPPARSRESAHNSGARSGCSTAAAALCRRSARHSATAGRRMVLRRRCTPNVFSAAQE